MGARHVAAVAAVVAFACLAPTEPAAAAADPKSRKTYDPNEVVCEKITVLGSRLAVKRVCATRAEWAERRREDRDNLDRSQRSPCVVTGASERC